MSFFFGEDEKRKEVLDCGSCKSLGPDGVNFDFLKEFLGDIQGDFIRFFNE